MSPDENVRNEADLPVDHPDDHEERFELLLAEAEVPERALEGNELEECAACRGLLEEHLELVASLERAGRAERSDLRAAARNQPSAGEQGRTAGRAEEALREQLELSAPPSSPFSLRWVAAAAVLALGLGTALLLARDGVGTPSGTGAPEDTWLGVRPELLAPKGDVEAYDEFSWRAELPDNGWFRVVVHNAVHNGEGDGALVARSPRLEEPHWNPAPEERSRWPDRIRWRLEVYRGTGAGDLVDSAVGFAARSL